MPCAHQTSPLVDEEELLYGCGMSTESPLYLLIGKPNESDVESIEREGHASGDPIDAECCNEMVAAIHDTRFGVGLSEIPHEHSLVLAGSGQLVIIPPRDTEDAVEMPLQIVADFARLGLHNLNATGPKSHCE